MIRRMPVLDSFRISFYVQWHVIQMVTLALKLAVFQVTKTRRFFCLKEKSSKLANSTSASKWIPPRSCFSSLVAPVMHGVRSVFSPVVRLESM